MLSKKINFFINFLEFKYRFFYLLLSFLLTFIQCFEYKIELFFFISEPFLNLQEYFIYTNLLDPILIYIKLSLFISIFLISPFFIYLFIFYFFKSLYTIYLYITGYFLLILFLLNIIMYYILFNILFKFLFKFLLTFERNKLTSLFQLHLEATINQYYSFFFLLIDIYIFLFFIPIIIFFLIIFNIIADKFFNNFLFRKYLYLGVFLIFLIIAPPDLFIQIFIVPLIFLILELYIYIITLFYLLYKTFRRWPSG